MEKLNRLGWAAGISFNSYGLHIGIRANEPAVLEQLVEYLPPGWKATPSSVVDHLYSVIAGGVSRASNVRRYNMLYGGAALVARSMDRKGLAEAFQNDLHLHVATFARRRLFIHAGVVGFQGQAILLPGQTLAGKSTLVLALVRSGATFYSDEYAVMDQRGRAYPFARPLSLRGSTDKTPERYSVADLGGQVGTKPLPVGLVVATSYVEGARWRPRLLSSGRAVLALLRHTVPARYRPESAFRILQRTVAEARVLQGVRGDAEETARLILEQVPQPVTPKSRTLSSKP